MLNFSNSFLKPFLVLFAIVFILSAPLFAQDCGTRIGGIYGSSDANERGYSLAPTQDNLGFYVAGIREDSILIIKADLGGNIEWSRTFMIVPGMDNHVAAMILDSEGMLALTGIGGSISSGGTVFAFRYDPANDQVLWSKVYLSGNRNYAFTIIQKGQEGNYIISNNPHYSGNDLAELLEINKNTGDVITTFSKNYDFGVSEQLADLVYFDKFYYGAGRYTFGFSPEGMRHSLVKINPNDGSNVWAKLGHIAQQQVARLYGFDVLIYENEIYSGYMGDPDGTSTSNTSLFLQKTSTDGELIWLKQYVMAGQNDFGYEIIQSDNGVVVLAGAENSNEIVLFKINADGDVAWSRSFDFPLASYAIVGRGSNQLIEIGDNLLFTGFGSDNSGNSDLLIVRTDLSGISDIPCVENNSTSVPIIKVSNPAFISIEPEELNFVPAVNSINANGLPSNIAPRMGCALQDSIHTFIADTICFGEVFEGYDTSGIFIDTFLLDNECDSIRTLTLTVIPQASDSIYAEICQGQSFEGYTSTGIYTAIFPLPSGCDSVRVVTLVVIDCQPIIEYDLDLCRSYMSDGSHMDYSEFIPSYPTVLSCADLSASFLHQEQHPLNKHSCTPGINGSPAMCVPALNSCTYSPGNSASVIIEFTIQPELDSIARFTGFEFYEKSPTTYTWIDGPSGPNNYPRFYGIRILKNGVEVFVNSGISTTTNWTLQSFDFIDNDLFKVETFTVFRIELLPYCPVGNGAEVSAWDIDEFKIFGGCVSPPVIFGNIVTKDNRPVKDVQILLSANGDFTGARTTITDQAGNYIFENVSPTGSHFIKGFKNDDLLNGISTLDLVHIQKYLLGIKPFGTLHQYVAADVNHDDNVNVVDIIELRKVLLGVHQEFPRNTSWRFGILPQDFTTTNLSSFRELNEIQSLAQDTLVADFVGIKIGDLNGDVQLDAWTPQIEKRSYRDLNLWMNDASLATGDPVSIEIRSEHDISISGLQFALTLKDLDLVTLKPGALNVSTENAFIASDGTLRISWSQAEALKIFKDEILFTLMVRPSLQSTLKASIKLVAQPLRPEAYEGVNLEVLKVNLSVRDSKDMKEEASFTVEPNPFQSSFNMHINLPYGGKTVITFYDLSGRILHQIDKEFPSGESIEKVLDQKQFPDEGIIYCQLVSNGFTAVQKIVKLE